MSGPRDSSGRRSFIPVVLLAGLAVLFAGADASAQEPASQPSERRFQLFAGFEPRFFYSDAEGFEYDGGAQLGIGYFWSPAISSEISVSLREGSYQEATVVDAAALYHFPSGSRWKFFAGSGFHYARVETASLLAVPVSQPPTPRNPPAKAASAIVPAPAVENDGVGWLVTGGVHYQFSSSFSLRMDARYVPITISGDRDSDDDFASTVGLGFRF